MDNKRPKKPQHESKNTTSNLFESIAAAVAAAPPPPLQATQSEPDIGARVSGKKRVSFGRNITVFHPAHTATAAAASSSTSYARMPSPVPTPLPPDFFNETRTLFDHIRLHENTGEGVGQGQAMMTFTFDNDNQQQQRSPPLPGSPSMLDQSGSTTISFGTRLQGTPTGQLELGTPPVHGSPTPILLDPTTNTVTTAIEDIGSRPMLLELSESASIDIGGTQLHSPATPTPMSFMTTPTNLLQMEAANRGANTGDRSHLYYTPHGQQRLLFDQIPLQKSFVEEQDEQMEGDVTFNEDLLGGPVHGTPPMLLDLSASTCPSRQHISATPTNLLQANEAADLEANTGIGNDPADLEANTGIGNDPADLEANTGIGNDPADLEANTGIGSDPADLEANTGIGSDTADLEANTGIGSDLVQSTTPTPSQEDPFAKFKVAAMFSKPIMELSDEEFAQQWEAGMEQLEAELVPAVQNYNEQKARYLEGQRRQLAIYEELQRRIRALDEEQEQWEAEFNALVNGEDDDDEEEEVEEEVEEEEGDEAAI